METKTIGLASDHAGYKLKQYVIEYCKAHGYAYKDYGTHSTDSCDYPDYGHGALRQATFIPALPSAGAAKA